MSVAQNTNAPIQFSTTGLPDDYCFTNAQRLNLDIVAALQGFLPGNYTTILVQEATPAVADRDKLWFKLETGGSPTGKLYMYFNGSWVSPNPEPSDSPVRRFVECSESDVWLYDGGSGDNPVTTPPTDAGGAMWSVDAEYSARIPIGAGTLPQSGTVLAVGDETGVDQITQTSAQMPVHAHDLKNIIIDVNTDTAGIGGIGLDQATYDTYQASGRVQTTIAGVAVQNAGGSGSPATTQPMNTISPVRAGYWIKRTARVFYLGA